MNILENKNYFIIAFEFPPYRGGIANYSHTLAASLGRKKHVVKVLTTNPESTSSNYYNVIKPMRQGYSGSIWILRKVVSFLYRIYQYLFLYLHLSTIISKRKNCRIIFTSVFFDFSFLAIKILQLFKVKYDVVLHGLDLHELTETRPKSFTKVISRANSVFTNSTYTGQIALQYFPEIKTTKFPPLIDSSMIDGLEILDKQTLTARLKVDFSKRLIVSVCRLVERKGIDTAILGASKFLAKQTNWLYLIIGEGSDKERLHNIIPVLLEDKILLLGSVSEQVKFSILHWSEVFLMPNREIAQKNVEGFGISFLEASYMKNWIIGGDNGGVPEAIDVSANGFLIDTENDPENQIFDALSQINAKHHKNDALERGRNFVLKNYALKNQWEL